MSQLQNNQSDYIIEFMNNVGLDYHPQIIKIKKDDLVSSLLNLNNFVKENTHLWFTIINTEKINNNWVQEITKNLIF